MAIYNRDDSQTALPQLEKRLAAVEEVGKKGLANFDILQQLIDKEILERERMNAKQDTSINTMVVKMFYLLADEGETPTSDDPRWSETMPNIDSSAEDKVLWYKSKTLRNGVVVKETDPQLIELMNGVFAFVNSVSGDNSWTTIDGGTIATGRIQDNVDGENYFDLDNGQFNFGDGSGDCIRWIGNGLEIYGSLSVQSNKGLVLQTPYTIVGNKIKFSATVYSLGVPITDNFADSDFAWYRKTEDYESYPDGKIPLGTGKNITVSMNDMDYGGVIRCEFSYRQEVPLLNDDRYQLTTKNGNPLIASV